MSGPHRGRPRPRDPRAGRPGAAAPELRARPPRCERSGRPTRGRSRTWSGPPRIGRIATSDLPGDPSYTRRAGRDPAPRGRPAQLLLAAAHLLFGHATRPAPERERRWRPAAISACRAAARSCTDRASHRELTSDADSLMLEGVADGLGEIPRRSDPPEVRVRCATHPGLLLRPPSASRSWSRPPRRRNRCGRARPPRCGPSGPPTRDRTRGWNGPPRRGPIGGDLPYVREPVAAPPREVARPNFYAEPHDLLLRDAVGPAPERELHLAEHALRAGSPRVPVSMTRRRAVLSLRGPGPGGRTRRSGRGGGSAAPGR